MNQIDKQFVESVEAAFFRTNEDTGANFNALMVWNRVRCHIGLPRLTVDDLPAYCVAHHKYHKINLDYGCQREP